MVCMNCNKRSVGCHSDCPEYLEYKKQCEKRKQLKLSDSNYNAYMNSVMLNNIKKKHHK